jgi:regulator of replication initiation timing
MAGDAGRAVSRLPLALLAVGLLGGYVASFIYNPQVDELSGERSSLLSRVSNLENTIFSLKNEVNALKQEREKLQAEVQRFRLELRDARGALEAARSLVSALELEVAELNKKVPRPPVEIEANLKRAASWDVVTAVLRNITGEVVTEVQVFLLGVGEDGSVSFEPSYGYTEIGKIDPGATITVRISTTQSHEGYLLIVLAAGVALVTPLP